MKKTQYLTTKVCVVGGGPAGIMLGFLLARSGVEVVVLEKQADFFRDFRGDPCTPQRLRCWRSVVSKEGSTHCLKIGLIERLST